MNIDIDSNEGGDCFIYQMTDDRFYIVVFVDKSQLEIVRNASAALSSGQETVLGTIGCGERVWSWRDESDYHIAVGNADSKDICYRISPNEVNQIVKSPVA